MRKPKRVRSSSQEEIEDLIRRCGPQLSWCDFNEVTPGRYRLKSGRVNDVMARYQEAILEEEAATKKIDTLTEELQTLREKEASEWYTSTLHAHIPSVQDMVDGYFD